MDPGTSHVGKDIFSYSGGQRNRDKLRGIFLC